MYSKEIEDVKKDQTEGSEVKKQSPRTRELSSRMTGMQW